MLVKKIKSILSRKSKHLILFGYYMRRISFFSKYKKRQIIVCFDGNVPHGGLVDRLKGIISFYEASKLIDSDFKILFNHPFELESFLVPNQIDWRIKKSEIKYTPFSTKIFYLINDFNSDPLELIKKTKAKKILIYSNVDYLSKLCKGKNEEELNSIWKNSYLELFKPSSYLLKKIDELPKIERLVFHTRFTSLMGDFKDTTKIKLDESRKNNLIQKVLGQIKEISNKYPGLIKYVLSDSKTFLNYIKENTEYITLDGVPHHLENNNNNKEYHLKTFLDFYFIVKSDIVCFVRIDEMYSSSFSKYASIIGNSKFIS
ncbi:hypothetical protein [Flavobacterium ajazii]|uniref:hypothetical protein n=1 Tax=Flavobacterium ajazii TaxID=2692318 RepID=UPI0013D3CAA2|nr:hypothetical protein [Flavobacterium ajazii]